MLPIPIVPQRKKCIICNEDNNQNTLIKCSPDDSCKMFPMARENHSIYYIHFHCSFFFHYLSIGLSKDMDRSYPIMKNFRIKGINKLLSSKSFNKLCTYCSEYDGSFMPKCYYKYNLVFLIGFRGILVIVTIISISNASLTMNNISRRSMNDPIIKSNTRCFVLNIEVNYP